MRFIVWRYQLTGIDAIPNPGGAKDQGADVTKGKHGCGLPATAGQGDSEFLPNHHRKPSSHPGRSGLCVRGDSDTGIGSVTFSVGA